jgi:hypothetical protein
MIQTIGCLRNIILKVFNFKLWSYMYDGEKFILILHPSCWIWAFEKVRTHGVLKKLIIHVYHNPILLGFLT